MRPEIEPLDRRDPSARPSATWRQEILAGSGLNLAAGLWLVLSPWVLGNGDAVGRHVLLGGLIGALALARVTGGDRGSWMSWVNALLGGVVVVAALARSEPVALRVSDVVVGALIVVLASLSAWATESANAGRGRSAEARAGRRRARGARSVVDALALLWVVAWLALGVFVAAEVRALANLSDTVTRAGRAVETSGSALGRLEGLPVVGERLGQAAAEARVAGARAQASARESRESIRRLSLVLGVAVAVLPSVPLLLLYLPPGLGRRPASGSG